MAKKRGKKSPVRKTGEPDVDALFAGPGIDEPVCTLEQWGSKRRWHRFIFPEETARNFVQSLSIVNPGGRIISIMHCDLECRFSTPPRTGRSAFFYAHPWKNSMSSYVMGIQHQPASARPVFQALETDLTLDDLGSGTGIAKLAKLFRSLKPCVGKDDVVLLNVTCLPMKTGDAERVRALLKKFRFKGEILYNDPDVDQSVPPMIQMVRRRLTAGRSRGKRKKTRSVNLVGFPQCREKDELILFLSDLGISLNVDMIPLINIEDLNRFEEGALTLFYPEIHFNRYYREIFRGIGPAALQPSAPFGMEGSRKWLEGIAAALGVEKKFHKYWRGWFAGVRKEWRACKEQAGEFSAGFAGAPHELKQCASPLHTAGIPMFSVLSEAGFHLELFVYGEERTGCGLMDFFISRYPALRERIHVISFGSADELRSALRESKSRIVFSDIFFDDRITGCGKTPFSMNYFRMGHWGCLRTCEDLVGACRLPFFRNYAEFAVLQ